MTRKLIRWTGYGGLILIGLVHLVPFYILVNLALRQPNDFTSLWLPFTSFRVDNFTEAWDQAGLARALANTAIVTVSALVILIVVGVLAAYPLARRPTKVNGVVYSLIVACMMVPQLTILVPLYALMVDINGVNQLWAVVLLHVTFNLPIVVFLYAGFIRTIPRELEEAAWIDGAGRIRTLFSVVFPLLKPVTATICIVVGVSIWNDFNFSLFFLQNNDVKTMTVALSTFFNQYNTYMQRAAAGFLMGSLPMIVMFLFLQKYFIKGLAAGAIKG